MNPPGINLQKLKAKVGKAPQPTGSTGVSATELAQALSEKAAALRDLAEARVKLAAAEAQLQKAENELTQLKQGGAISSAPASPNANTDALERRIKDISSEINSTVDGVIQLIESYKIVAGSPGEATVNEIEGYLQKLDALLNPQTP